MSIYCLTAGLRTLLGGVGEKIGTAPVILVYSEYILQFLLRSLLLTFLYQVFPKYFSSHWCLKSSEKPI